MHRRDFVKVMLPVALTLRNSYAQQTDEQSILGRLLNQRNISSALQGEVYDFMRSLPGRIDAWIDAPGNLHEEQARYVQRVGKDAAIAHLLEASRYGAVWFAKESQPPEHLALKMFKQRIERRWAEWVWKDMYPEATTTVEGKIVDRFPADMRSVTAAELPDTAEAYKSHEQEILRTLRGLLASDPTCPWRRSDRARTGNRTLSSESLFRSNPFSDDEPYGIPARSEPGFGFSIPVKVRRETVYISWCAAMVLDEALRGGALPSDAKIKKHDIGEKLNKLARKDSEFYAALVILPRTTNPTPRAAGPRPTEGWIG